MGELAQEMDFAKPSNCGCARNRSSEPSGLARRQEKLARRSGGSDSGSTKSPYSVLAKLSAAAIQNGRRGSTLPASPPSAGPSTTHPAARNGRSAAQAW